MRMVRISAPVSRGRGVFLSKGSPDENGAHSVSQPPPTEITDPLPAVVVSSFRFSWWVMKPSWLTGR